MEKKLQQLLLNGNDTRSNEYKEGWNSAIGFVNDNYKIQDRNSEPISIVFEATIDEEDIMKIMRDCK